MRTGYTFRTWGSVRNMVRCNFVSQETTSQYQEISTVIAFSVGKRSLCPRRYIVEFGTSTLYIQSRDLRQPRNLHFYQCCVGGSETSAIESLVLPRFSGLSCLPRSIRSAELKSPQVQSPRWANEATCRPPNQSTMELREVHNLTARPSSSAAPSGRNNSNFEASYLRSSILRPVYLPKTDLPASS